MKEQFVTYEIALALKELGFDEECFCTYHNAELSRNPSHKIDATPIQGKPYVWKNSKVHNSIVCAPLWQQCVDWFREKYDIVIEIFRQNYFDTYVNSYVYETICKVYKNRELDGSVVIRDNKNSHIFYSYEEAREQAILKAIELWKKNYHKK